MPHDLHDAFYFRAYAAPFNTNQLEECSQKATILTSLLKQIDHRLTARAVPDKNDSLGI